MSEITTNFRDSSQDDLGKNLVSREYLLSVYPKLASGLFASGTLVNGNTSSSTVSKRFLNVIRGSSIDPGQGLSSPLNFDSAFNNWKSIFVQKFGESTAFIKNDGTLWILPSLASHSANLNYVSSVSSPTQESTSSTNWKKVSFGTNHTSALKTDGTLWTWGTNSYGQLGTNSTQYRTTPVQEATSSTNWKDVGCGQNITYGIKTDGTLWGWGLNDDGYLGNGPTVTWNVLTNVRSGTRAYSSPIRIGTASDWKEIINVSTSAQDDRTIFTTATGYKFIGKKQNNTIWGWGAIIDSGFIDGRIFIPTPVQFDLAPGYIWKTVPTTVSPENFPISVNQLDDSDTDLTSESHYEASFGIRNDGTLWAWGIPSWVANGRHSFPVRYYNPGVSFAQEWTSSTNWKQITTGESGGLGIKTDGTLWGWATTNYNTSPYIIGKIAPSISNEYTPYQIGTSNNWKQVSVGGIAAAVKTDGTLWTWGYPTAMQLRLSLTNGTQWNTTPTQEFSSSTNWQQVSVGKDSTFGSNSHCAAIKTDGTLWSWGSNSSGQLGVNDIIDRTTPVQEFTSSTNWVQVSCGAEHTVAIKSDGTLWSWGNNNFEAVTDDGIRTSYDGVLGVGARSGDARTPMQEWTSSTNWRQVSAGRYYNAAIKTDGSLWAWGQNTAGKLGIGEISAHRGDRGRSTPTRVGSANDWNFVTCGGETTLGIKNDGTLWGWGYNGWGGPCGNNLWKKCLVYTAVQEKTDSRWDRVYARSSDMVGIRTDGTMWDLGMDATWKIRSVKPVTIGYSSNDWKEIFSITSGWPDPGGCALKTDGTLWFWGRSQSFGVMSAPNTFYAPSDFDIKQHSPIQERSFSNNWKTVIMRGTATGLIFAQKFNL